MTTSPSPTPATMLQGQAKLDEVTRLIGKLSADLQERNLEPHERDLLLEQLKIYGRDANNAGPIFTKEGIKTLARHAFDSSSFTTSRNALRCIANAMLLRVDTRQIFLDLGYASKACDKLQNDSRDDEFLVSRILHLLTYETKMDIEKLVDEHRLAETVCINIGRHTKKYVEQREMLAPDAMEDMALDETLRLLFNLAHLCPQRARTFSPALSEILLLLRSRPTSSSRPLDPPISDLVNALLSLDLEDKANFRAIFPEEAPNINVTIFVEKLGKSVQVSADNELEHRMTPLLTLLRRVLEIAPPESKSYLGETLLPSRGDRAQPLGRANSLASRLLRLSTNATTPQLRDCISGLLFELSDKDASKFVHNVGYGYAAGFLFQHHIPIPQNALETSSLSDSHREDKEDSTIRLDGNVNPITGQFLEKEAVVEGPEMTQEEKEREAERLFVLFERLRATGVVDVQNPVAAAYQQGRIQELDDDPDLD